jgi:hypothetical protein
LARSLADRVIAEASHQALDRQLTYAFRAVLSRKPEEAELAQLRAIFQEAGERYRSDSQAARELIGKRPIPAGATAADWTAWFSVCHVLLNLDETITKG